MQQPQLRRHRDFVQNAIDPIANAQVVFQRFDMDIGGALDDRFTDDLVYEFDDGRFRIVRIQIGARFDFLERLRMSGWS